MHDDTGGIVTDAEAAGTIRQTDFHDEREFQSVNFSEMDLTEQTFENCTFVKCRFLNMTIASASFQDCVFEECEIVVVKLHGVALSNTVFKLSLIRGVNFSDCSDFGFSPEFHGCVINHCVLDRKKLRKGVFAGSQLADCDLIACDFREVDFSNTTFARVNIQDCNFEKADFRTSTGYVMNPATNKVRGARFSLPEAQSFLLLLGIRLEK